MLDWKPHDDTCKFVCMLFCAWYMTCTGCVHASCVREKPSVAFTNMRTMRKQIILKTIVSCSSSKRQFIQRKREGLVHS